MSYNRNNRQVRIQIPNMGQDPLDASRFRTQDPSRPEDFVQPIYDRVNFPAAGTTTELSFFSTILGGSATLIRAGATGTFNKTYRDTNVQTPNMLSSKLITVYGICISFAHEDEGEKANPIDRDKLRNGGYFQLRVNDKEILTGPIVLLPEVNPIVVASTTSSDSTIIGSAGGGGPNVPMYRLSPIPITINPGETFTFKMSFDGTITLTKAIDVTSIFIGSIRRPS